MLTIATHISLNCSFPVLSITVIVHKIIIPKIIAIIPINSPAIGRKIKESIKSHANLKENTSQTIESIPKTKLTITNLDILLVLLDFNKLLFWVTFSILYCR